MKFNIQRTGYLTGLRMNNAEIWEGACHSKIGFVDYCISIELIIPGI